MSSQEYLYTRRLDKTGSSIFNLITCMIIILQKIQREGTFEGRLGLANYQNLILENTILLSISAESLSQTDEEILEIDLRLKMKLKKDLTRSKCSH